MKLAAYPTFLACSLLVASMSGCGESATPPGFSILAKQVPGGMLLAVASVGDEAIFVGGQLNGGKGFLARYSGESLCVERDVSDRALWWIHSSGASEWYAVGEKGTIIHSLGGVRTDESVPTDSVLYGVYDAGDRVIAVGGDVFGTKEGEVWVKDDGTWTQLASGLPGVAFKVWEDFIVGDGIAYKVVGDSLEEHFPPDGAKLTTVTGRGANDIYAVGGTARPVMLHWDGSDWSNVEVDSLCADQGLNGVWTEAGTGVWFAGSFGKLGEYINPDWNCPTDFLTQETFHGVVGFGDEILWAGGNFFEIGGNYGTIGRYGEGDKTLSATDCP